MPDVTGSTSIYLLPGMQAKFKVSGYFVALGKKQVLGPNNNYVEKELINGYAVQFDDVGKLEAVENEPAVIYTHRKFGLNKIFFFARTGEISIVDVIAVPIHDHSSIVAGGPSYASYFTDEETEE